MKTKDALPLVLTYTNHRGETGVRRIIPLAAPWWGQSDYHGEPQWLLRAFDVDKQAEREFAMADIWTGTVEVLPDGSIAASDPATHDAPAGAEGPGGGGAGEDSKLLDALDGFERMMPEGNDSDPLIEVFAALAGEAASALRDRDARIGRLEAEASEARMSWNKTHNRAVEWRNKHAEAEHRHQRAIRALEAERDAMGEALAAETKRCVTAAQKMASDAYAEGVSWSEQFALEWLDNDAPPETTKSAFESFAQDLTCFRFRLPASFSAAALVQPTAETEG